MPLRPDHPFESGRLREAIRLRRRREQRARRDHRRPIGQDLAMAGAIGWTIVVPALIGIALGRWLDRRFAAGVFWTLGLLVAGIALGCALAWRRLMRP
jgi:ATP synthase protein I